MVLAVAGEVLWPGLKRYENHIFEDVDGRIMKHN